MHERDRPLDRLGRHRVHDHGRPGRFRHRPGRRQPAAAIGHGRRARARLPLGEEAVARIRGKLERQLADLETTMDLTLSTAYS